VENVLCSLLDTRRLKEGKEREVDGGEDEDGGVEVGKDHLTTLMLYVWMFFFRYSEQFDCSF
jgi:hypothetical protein